MVTPELKWPMTNFTPSPTNLLATETPSLGIAAVVADEQLDLLAEDAARALMSATACSTPFLQLRAEGGAAAGHRAADADLDLGRGRCRRSATARPNARAERIPFLHNSPSE